MSKSRGASTSENTVRKTSDSLAYSLTKRREFLHALAQYWPDLLESFYRNVFLPHREVWVEFLTIKDDHGNLNKRPGRSMDSIRFALLNNEIAELVVHQALSRLLQWATAHGISRNTWLLDTAVDTLRFWLVNNDLPRQWLYCPEHFRIREFAPDFGAWVPTEQMPRTKVRQMWSERFDQELQCYLNSVEVEYGSRADAVVTRHAAWTAMNIAGKTVAQIVNSMPVAEARSYKSAEASVRIAINRFKNSIGLDWPNKTAK